MLHGKLRIGDGRLRDELKVWSGSDGLTASEEMRVTRRWGNRETPLQNSQNHDRHVVVLFSAGDKFIGFDENLLH